MRHRDLSTAFMVLGLQFLMQGPQRVIALGDVCMDLYGGWHGVCNLQR